MPDKPVPFTDKERLHQLFIVEAKSYKEIAEILNLKVWQVQHSVRILGVNTNGNKKRCKDLTSQEFGKLTVLNRVELPENRHNIRGGTWNCICSCGRNNTRSANGNSLIKGAIYQCHDCDNDEMGVEQYQLEERENLKSWHYKRLMKSAKNGGRSFNITLDALEKLFLDQGGNCALSYLPITLPKTWDEFDKGLTSASLDRRDNEKGYSIDNVWWIHKDINRMKNIFTLDRFLDLCCRIHDFAVSEFEIGQYEEDRHYYDDLRIAEWNERHSKNNE